MISNARPGRTRWIVLSVVALVAVAGGVMAIRSGAEGASVTQVRGPDMGHARKTAFEITTTAVGELEAKRNVELRNPLEDTATIVTIVEEGSAVRAGDVLIQLNSDPIKTRVDEETLRVESGRAELVAAQNSYDIQVNENASRLRDAQLKVELAEIALRQWEEGDLKKRLQSLDLEINRATLELDRLAEKLLNSEEVYAAGYMSKDERDRDEVAYIQAIAAYKDANLALDVYEQYEVVADRKQKESDVQSARDELARIHLDNAIELASKQANLNNKRTSLSILEAKLAKLKAQFSAATIRAPQDGLVVYATSLERGGWGGRGDGPLQIGQQVFPNQLMMILPDTSSMVAAVRVQESLAGRVRPGQPASVKIDAAGGRIFGGTVESIGVMAETGGWRDPNLREYTVRIAVDPAGTDLKPAMRAEARITLGSVEEAIAVPVQAVFNDGAVHYVYTPQGGRFVRVPVKLGRRSDTLAEIRAGVSEGATVLLREPTPAEILREPWNEAQLTLAGYKKNEEGQIIAEGAGQGSPPPGNAGRGRRPGGGQPGSAGEGAGAQPAGGQGSRPSEGTTPTSGQASAASKAESPAASDPAAMDTRTVSSAGEAPGKAPAGVDADATEANQSDPAAK